MSKRDDMRVVLSRMVHDALDQGYTLNVDNGGDRAELPRPSTSAQEVLDAMMATDDEHLLYHRDGRCVGWVWLIYSNDVCEMIADNTTNLEDILRGAMDIMEQYA